MKRVYGIIFVLFIMLTAIVLYVIISGNQIPDGNGVGPVENTIYNNLRNDVESLNSKAWDKELYDGIIINIRANRNANNIDSDQASDLKHLATLYYIDKLNQATRNFFQGSCDDPGVLAALNRELIRLYDMNQYASRVDEMRRATSKVYQLLGYTRGQERRGWTNEVRRFAQQDFEEERALYLRRHILEFLEKPYLGNCSLVKESVHENMTKLNDIHFSYLSDKVFDYVTTMDFEKDYTFEMYSEIERYRDLRYIPDIEWIESNADSLVLILYEHQLKYEANE